MADLTPSAAALLARLRNGPIHVGGFGARPTAEAERAIRELTRRGLARIVSPAGLEIWEVAGD